jgi:hypothetical protein
LEEERRKLHQILKRSHKKSPKGEKRNQSLVLENPKLFNHLRLSPTKGSNIRRTMKGMLRLKLSILIKKKVFLLSC